MAGKQEIIAELENAKTALGSQLSHIQSFENRFDSLDSQFQMLAEDSSTGIDQFVQEGLQASMESCTRAVESVEAGCKSIDDYINETL